MNEVLIDNWNKTINEDDEIFHLGDLALGGKANFKDMPPVHQLPNDNSNKYKILFVCLGNICRSPAAQGIMEKMIADRGLQDRFYVDSAGTYGGHNGSLPDERMRIHARRRGYELTHLSRQVTGHDFETFDLIVITDKNNLHGLRCMKDVVDERKVVEIARYLRMHPGHDSVPDPYYDGAEGFELVLDLLEDACHGLLDELCRTV